MVFFCFLVEFLFKKTGTFPYCILYRIGIWLPISTLFLLWQNHSLREGNFLFFWSISLFQITPTNLPLWRIYCLAWRWEIAVKIQSSSSSAASTLFQTPIVLSNLYEYYWNLLSSFLRFKIFHPYWNFEEIFFLFFHMTDNWTWSEFCLIFG